ncbi:MAG TPA: ATP-binding protein [Candidatus Sulfotelmatobacter sp.]|nr:ATP-binding protein [Candidatus Sulfotelmatobacter sp.]
MKSCLSNFAGVRGRSFRCALFGLLVLAAGVPLTRADSGLGADSTNYPTIYTEKPSEEVTNGLGFWLWDRVTFDKQTVRFWNCFEVPKTNPVVRAELRIAADNAYKVWLDGQEIGSGSDWRTLSIYHLEGTLNPGPHVLAVEGFNDNDQAGLILGMRLETANGKTIHIPSDLTWRVVPNAESDWQTAIVPGDSWPNASVARNFGRLPWWTIPTSVLHIRALLPKPDQFWQTRTFQIGMFAGCGIFIVMCLYLLIQLVSQSKAHHLVQAERDRIARDIHDDLGSKITQLLLAGEVAQIKPEEHADPGAPLAQMCDSARTILATIDEVVWIVNSQHDNLDDFVIYLCKHTQKFLDATGIRCRFDVAPELPGKVLSQLTRRNLFLAVKEALNNAARHAQATEVTVRIELDGLRLLVMVADNGRGFDPRSVSEERNGLTNMKQRLSEIGGSFQVASRPGEGCQVTFSVPLKRDSLFKTPISA